MNWESRPLINLHDQPDRPPAKAIPPRRDQLQSVAITAVLGALILYAAVFGVIAGGEEPGGGSVALVSIGFALLVVSMRASSPWGAFWGALCCFTLIWWTRGVPSPLLHSLLPALAVLVFVTAISTRAGRHAKQARGLADHPGGRGASQVLANLGAATLFVSPLGAYAALAVGRSLPVETSLLFLAGTAALAEAAADTVASELGQLIAGRGRTVLITTLRRVPRGTDGGVSLLGTLCGVLAAIIVVAVAALSLHLRWPQAVTAAVAAIAGLFFDSVLGATLERRGWIGNDAVNLASTIFAGLAAMALLRLGA